MVYQLSHIIPFLAYEVFRNGPGASGHTQLKDEVFWEVPFLHMPMVC